MEVITLREEDSTIASGLAATKVPPIVRGAKVLAAKNSHRLMPLRQGSAVTQTTNFRDRPPSASGMGFRGL